MQPNAVFTLEDMQRLFPGVEMCELEDDGFYIVQIKGLRDASSEDLLKLHSAIQGFGVEALLIDDVVHS